jgi:two-component system response regulator PilR (NtrC family)
MILKVAPAKTNVLIIGESGTGKELVARMIHDSGPLKGKPFIPVNCGAIPENLIESEMFGHKKGSFTGAVADKVGLFQAADGGTLFLDEVGELPLQMQVKLLRAIQDRMVRKVGSNDDVKIDVRIIAATNRNLEEAVKKGTFREDLYYRLNVLLIKTPPLRERGGDIEFLAKIFVDRFSERQGRKGMKLSEESLEAVKKYAWPGNIRELENTMERVVTLEPGMEIQIQHFPTNVRAVGDGSAKGTSSNEGLRENSIPDVPPADFSKGPIRLDKVVKEVERFYLEKALAHTGGDKKKAAELLKLSSQGLNSKLKNHQLL